MTRLTVPVRLRWGDLDAYQHVNNTAMLQLLEEVRIDAFWRHDDGSPSPYPTAVLDTGPGAEVTTLVARQEIEYLHPIGYRRAPLVVELWIGYLGGASIDVCYEVRDEEATTEPYARASTTIVLVDAATGRPRRIGDVERAAWAPFVEEPVAFRRRRSGTAPAPGPDAPRP